MRPIDADALKKVFCEECGLADVAHCEDSCAICDVINTAPTLDVQPVIKCRDCHYAILTSDGMCKYCTSGIFVTELYLDGDFYCAKAKRKEKDNNDNN